MKQPKVVSMRVDDPMTEFADYLQQQADRVVNLILHSDLPWVDIAIQIEQLRYLCEEEAPEKMAIFEMLYEARFHRLWEQWRLAEPDPYLWALADG